MLDREANETPSNSNSPRANKLIIKLTFVSSTYTITRGASRPGQTQEAKARVEKCKKKIKRRRRPSKIQKHRRNNASPTKYLNNVINARAPRPASGTSIAHLPLSPLNKNNWCFRSLNSSTLFELHHCRSCLTHITSSHA
jgi:hypothetical protein